MRHFIAALSTAILVAVVGGSARAADATDATAILDKAIKALGGEDKLSKAKIVTWKAKGKITFDTMDNDFSTVLTAQGLDHFRQEFEGEFGGNKVKGALVLHGDKAWRKFGDDTMELDKEAVANEKRNVYLQLLPTTLVALKGKGYKLETAPEEKVGDKPAVGIKVTPPDGKDFTIHFDKESGLPVKQVAKTVGFQGEDFTQETLFSKYKEFDGIKKPTHIENKRDGKAFMTMEVTEFKVLDKVDAKTFAEPK